MSHIPVLVVGPDLHGQLAAYQDIDYDARRVLSRDLRTPKWDWCTVGGRWSAYFSLRAGYAADHARKSEVDWDATWAAADVPCAYVKDGDWHERGTAAREEWERRVRDMVAALHEGTLLTLVDCHE